METSKTLMAILIMLAVLAAVGGVVGLSGGYIGRVGAVSTCQDSNQLVSASLQAIQIGTTSLSQKKTLQITASPAPEASQAAATVTITEATSGPNAGIIQVNGSLNGANCINTAVAAHSLTLPDATSLPLATPSP